MYERHIQFNHVQHWTIREIKICLPSERISLLANLQTSQLTHNHTRALKTRGCNNNNNEADGNYVRMTTKRSILFRQFKAGTGAYITRLKRRNGKNSPITNQSSQPETTCRKWATLSNRKSLARRPLAASADVRDKGGDRQPRRGGYWCKPWVAPGVARKAARGWGRGQRGGGGRLAGGWGGGWTFYVRSRDWL